MLEAKAAEAGELEARLQHSEQEMIALSQEASQLNVQFQEAKAKWSDVQNDVLATAERESASIERLNNLEAALNSKAEEVDAAEDKRAQMNERYKRIMEHNKAKMGVTDIDDEIAKARELELTARRRLPTQPDATDSSGSSSEFSGNEEELEENNDEGQDPEPMEDPPTSPGGADASLPLSSGGDVV
ncbi:uncharacterized protein [Nicotiana tomentosiformis]|uniref:uncharacterized protein n=1 Tax=Nicotiana tomentosiformis TaxID=4098 RepID=UPI00388C5153